MSRKHSLRRIGLYLLIITVLFGALLTSGCQSNVTEKTEVDVGWNWDEYSDSWTFRYLPSKYEFVSNTVFPDRRYLVCLLKGDNRISPDTSLTSEQIRNSSHRIVAEQMLPNIDMSVLDNFEKIKSDGVNLISYYYGDGNYIDYAEMPASIPDVDSRGFTPKEGDAVLEWKTDNFSCRIFGAVSQEELLKVAENWVGFKY